MWFMLSYLAWAISAALVAWMVWDWVRTDSTHSEELLTSSREGEIEAQTERHKA